jgi:hypothetical protein
MLKRWKHCGKMKKPQIQIGQWPKQQTLLQKGAKSTFGTAA